MSQPEKWNIAAIRFPDGKLLKGFAAHWRAISDGLGESLMRAEYGDAFVDELLTKNRPNRTASDD